MSYRADDFIISSLQELFDAGFIDTAREIARTIADGEVGRPYKTVQQESITADIIEHNIIRPFEAWQKIVKTHGPNDQGDKDEKFLIIVDQSGQQVSLGSHSYGPSIKALREFVRDLRFSPVDIGLPETRPSIFPVKL